MNWSQIYPRDNHEVTRFFKRQEPVLPRLSRILPCRVFTRKVLPSDDRQMVRRGLSTVFNMKWHLRPDASCWTLAGPIPLYLDKVTMIGGISYFSLLLALLKGLVLAEAWVEICLSVQALIGIERWNATKFSGLYTATYWINQAKLSLKNT
jgi:hypothetical protein